MADVFDPFGNGGNGLGLSEGDATSLALLHAMSQIGQAGLQRTASPIGSIAQNLAPLFAAPIQAHQIQQQSVIEDLIARAHMVNALAQMQNAINAGQGGEETPKTFEQAAVQKALKDPNVNWAALYKQFHPEKSEKPTEASLALDAAGGNAQGALDKLSALNTAKAQAASNIIQTRQQNMETFKAGLPARMSDKDRETIASGKTLLGLLGDAESVMGTIPKDMTEKEFGRSALNYQWRANHPELLNLQKANPLGGIVGAVTGINGESDPRLDTYFSWIGQVKAALGSFNVQGQRGGIRLLQYLKDHFPDYGDSPAQTLNKAKNLRTDRAVIERRLNDLVGELHNNATQADVPGGQSDGGWVGRPVFDKSGVEKRLWVNPSTGQKMLLNPDQAPPLE